MKHCGHLLCYDGTCVSLARLAQRIVTLAHNARTCFRVWGFDQDYRGGGSATPACGLLYPDVSHRTSSTPMMKTLEQLFSNATRASNEWSSSNVVSLPRRWSEAHVQSWGLSLAHAVEALHARQGAAGFVSPFTVFVPIEQSTTSSAGSSDNAKLGGTVLLCEQAALFLWKQLCSSHAGHDARAALLGPSSHSSSHDARGSPLHSVFDASKLPVVRPETIASFLPPEVLEELSTRTDTGNDANSYTSQFVGEWVCGSLYGVIDRAGTGGVARLGGPLGDDEHTTSVMHYAQGGAGRGSLDLQAVAAYMFERHCGGWLPVEFHCLNFCPPIIRTITSINNSKGRSRRHGGGRSPQEGVFGLHTTLPQAATQLLESLESYDNALFQGHARRGGGGGGNSSSFSHRSTNVEALQPQLLATEGDHSTSNNNHPANPQHANWEKYYTTQSLFGSAGQLMRQLRLSLMRSKVARGSHRSTHKAIPRCKTRSNVLPTRGRFETTQEPHGSDLACIRCKPAQVRRSN